MTLHSHEGVKARRAASNGGPFFMVMPSAMKEFASDVAQYIPFIGLAVGGHQQQPIVTRLIESAIIGGVVLFGTVQVLGERIDHLKNQVTELRTEQAGMRMTISDLRVAQAQMGRAVAPRP
ncbi:MAG: hypothetical protein Q8M07_01110 [Prosthecobacter sp.]|nr:hypothetical protein [Prosthecobacter sp.]